MGWIAGLWKRIAGARPDQLIYAPSIRADHIRGEPLVQDECYVELYLESAKLSYARKFATVFDGVVYSFVALPQEGREKAQVAAVSKPAKLTDLDPKSLDRVITLSKQMMGAVPFRGHPIELELGLFSVKKGNLLTPVVDYVTRVSSIAGISYVGAVTPFLPLLTEGMDLVAGQSTEIVLEVGLDTSITAAQSFVGAIVTQSRASMDPSKLELRPDGTLLHDGAPIDTGYAVFSLRRNLQKADYGEIPELKSLYATFISAIKRNQPAEAKDALRAFQLATQASPDLISRDARRLSALAAQKYRTAFPPGGEASDLLSKIDESLSDIGLYSGGE